MRFMLEEYDALPFGLLRHGKAGSPCGKAEAAPKFVHCCPDPGQKVMPLDKVCMPQRRNALVAPAESSFFSTNYFVDPVSTELLLLVWRHGNERK